MLYSSAFYWLNVLKMINCFCSTSQVQKKFRNCFVFFAVLKNFNNFFFLYPKSKKKSFLLQKKNLLCEKVEDFLPLVLKVKLIFQEFISCPSHNYGSQMVKKLKNIWILHKIFYRKSINYCRISGSVGVKKNCR